MSKLNIYYGWYIVAACFCLCFLFAGAGFYSFSIFIRPIEAEFGWSRSAISLTMSIYLIIGGLTGPLFGKWVQQYGPRKVMRFCALGAGACFMLVSLTQSLWYFYLVYALLAITVSGIGIIPVSSLLSRWFDKRIGRAMGFSMVGISAGGLLLAPCVGWITTAFGWKTAFFSIGLLVWALALPIVTFVIRDTPPEPDPPPPTQTTDPAAPKPRISLETMGWPAHKALASRSFWLIFTSFLLGPLAQMGVLQHQVPLIMDTGMTEPLAATVLGVTAGIGGLGKLSFGRISESIPFRMVILICYGIQALAIFLLLLTQTPLMVWVYAALFGFGMGGIVVLIPLVVSHYWGLHSYGVILGVLWVANAMGGALGTYSSGLIYDIMGHYQWALYLFAAAYLMGIGAFLMAGKPKPYHE